MHHGHRGLNHPVKNLITGKCEITTQNHGFGVDPEAVKSGDVEMLQDLIIAAVNEASRKADEAMKGKLGSKLGGMGLPDGLL